MRIPPIGSASGAEWATPSGYGIGSVIRRVGLVALGILLLSPNYGAALNGPLAQTPRQIVSKSPFQHAPMDVGRVFPGLLLDRFYDPTNKTILAVDISDPETPQIFPSKRILQLDLDYATELEEVVETILQTSPAYQVLQKALNRGSLTILPGNDLTAPDGVRWDRGTIWIRGNSPAEQQENLLFALHHCLYKDRADTAAELARERRIEKSEFIKRMVKIGEDARRGFQSTLSECIHRWGWSRESALGAATHWDVQQHADQSADRFWRRERRSHSDL